MDNSTHPQNEPQEVDLGEMLKKTGLGLKRGGEWLYRTLQTVAVYAIRKSLWLMGFVVVGCAISFFMYKSATPYYDTHMLLHANVRDNVFFVNMVNDLCQARDYRTLTQKLHLPDTALTKNIRFIQACFGVDVNKDNLIDFIDIQGRYIHGDSAKAAQVSKNYFYINASVYSDTVLPYIKQGILEVLHGDEYVEQQNAARFDQIRAEIDILSQQIDRLDSLQRVEYFDKDRRQGGGRASDAFPMMVLTEKDQRLYHDDIIRLNNRRKELETGLALNPDAVTLTKDFSVLLPAQNTFMTYAKRIILQILLLGIACLLLWDHRKKIIQRIKEKR